MDQFINTKETLVTEALDGLLRTSGGRIARLDGYPHVKVVVRSDGPKDRVALVSGGGSGHEPAHAGFVGEGMLTAAVCGEVFASPSVDAVLAGILAVTGAPGCLLIVKNYTGDRLNFGLAAEKARALGYEVEMVVVEDDVAIPDAAQARGVAGTLFVHKVAGAVAAEGADLATVAAAARRVADKVVSIGMSLDTCMIPGAAREARIEPGQAELGLGIHGEPGIEKVPFDGARGAVALVLSRLRDHYDHTVPHALLLNNLGSCTELEMGVLAEEITRSDLADALTRVVGPAPLMTSLDMRGFSVSLLALTEREQAWLDAPTGAPAWPGSHAIHRPDVLPMPAGLGETAQPTPSADPQRRAWLLKACGILEAQEADLNALDAKTGDGDTGSTVATAARAVSAMVDALPLADPPALLRAISGELSTAMGGSSGVLLAIFCAAAGEAAEDGAGLPAALEAGLDRMMAVGGARPGDRTMIDALAPALEALAAGEAMPAVAAAARQGADATRAMAARAGRSANVSIADLEGHADPGAEAVARLFAGLA